VLWVPKVRVLSVRMVLRVLRVRVRRLLVLLRRLLQIPLGISFEAREAGGIAEVVGLAAMDVRAGSVLGRDGHSTDGVEDLPRRLHPLTISPR
jgi:hypothetical protein